MSEFTVILYDESQEHIVRIVLKRHDAGNAVNHLMALELKEACRRINENNNIYAAVITGSGNDFCTGGEMSTAIPSVANEIAGIEQPVIAAINGDAIGQGLEVILACDIRIATPQARFGMPQITAGLLPADGGTQRLPRIIGTGKALEMILTGDIIDAEEALQMGLIHRIVPEDRLDSEINKTLETMVTRAPWAMRYAKEAVNKGLDLTLDQGLRLEADLYYLLHTTSDRTEGIKAFQQKRNPEFKEA